MKLLGQITTISIVIILIKYRCLVLMIKGIFFLRERMFYESNESMSHESWVNESTGRISGFSYGQYKMQTADCRPGTKCRLSLKCRLTRKTAFCVRNEITFDFISYLLSRNNLTMSSPINNTILNSLFFCQKCHFTAWFGTDLFLVAEISKDITHVKLLPSLVAKIVYLLFTCEIHDTRHLHAA